MAAEGLGTGQIIFFCTPGGVPPPPPLNQKFAPKSALSQKFDYIFDFTINNLKSFLFFVTNQQFLGKCGKCGKKIILYFKSLGSNARCMCVQVFIFLLLENLMLPWKATPSTDHHDIDSRILPTGDIKKHLNVVDKVPA